MRRNWQSLRVGSDTSLRETLRVIDKNRMGIALVVDSRDRLQGTVTDGDIRRAILRDVPLDAPVAGIMSRGFVSLSRGAAAAAALTLMQERQVKQVPVLGDAGEVLGVYYLPDLVGHEPKPNWVVIMAGGEGRRLRPLTEETPKPMLPIGGQPILETTLRRLVFHGFHRIFLAVNYRGERIEQYFGDGSRFDCRIEYLREAKPLDTGGALGLLPEAPEDPLLVLNADLITELDFSALLDYHMQHRGVATLCVRELVQQIPYGVVCCEGELLVALEEKPVERRLINAGIYVIEPRLIAFLPRGEPYSLPRLIEEGQARGEKVFAFFVHEPWMDIGRPDDYERVRNGPGGKAPDG